MAPFRWLKTLLTIIVSNLALLDGNRDDKATNVGYVRVSRQDQNPQMQRGELDDKDSAAFFSGSTYMVTSQPTDNSTASHTNIAVRCDIGDVALGGGYESLDPNEGTVRADGPVDVSTVAGVQQAWNVQWVNKAPSMDSNVVAMVRCADFGQAHQ
jgi:hypothetical protein